MLCRVNFCILPALFVSGWVYKACLTDICCVLIFSTATPWYTLSHSEIVHLELTDGRVLDVIINLDHQSGLSPKKFLQGHFLSWEALVQLSTFKTNFQPDKGMMNLEEYFKRIGFHGTTEKADLATLKLIHKQHVMSVPFENLSIHCGEKIAFDLEAIFEKIVRRGRGGWCMETNVLFGWVLREMGFDTVTLGARVYSSVLNDFNPMEAHVINMVTIEGEAHIADVSFGNSSQIWEPLELVSGKDQPQAPGIFRLIEKGDFWVLEKTRRKPEFLNPDFATSNLVNRKETYQIYGFTLAHREINDFSEANYFYQTDPTSVFTNKTICSLQTEQPTGFRALIGWTYSEVTYKPEKGVDILDMRQLTDEQIEPILREKFNLKLQSTLIPVDKKAHYKI